MPLIAYLSCSYLNKLNFGYFTPTSTSGLTRAQNCVYFAEKTPKEFEWIGIPYAKFREKAIRENTDVAMSIWFAISSGSYDKHNLTFEQLSFEFGRYANATILQNPKEYLIQVFTRSWFDFWKTNTLWSYENFNSQAKYEVVNHFWGFQHILLRLLKLFFVILSPYYQLLFFKNRKLTNEFIICSIALTTSILQALATYGNNNRFSFPFEFVMIILIFMFLKNKISVSKHLDIFQQ